jgi:hypothetical protein
MAGKSRLNHRFPVMADELDIYQALEGELKRDKETWDFKYTKGLFTWEEATHFLVMLMQ